jgi:hypothetical protein
MTSIAYRSSKRSGYDAIDPSNLYLYYPFNSSTVNGNNVGNMATGSIVYDATLVSPTTIVNDKMTTSSSGYYGTIINKVIPCSTSTGVSVSLWFNVSSFPTNTYYFLFTIEDAKGYVGGGKRIFYSLDPSRKITVNGQLDTPFSITPNKNYHLVVTITPENVGKMYLNNILVASGTISYPSFINESGYNCIGRDPTVNPGIVGTIDEFRLYNRILTASEVNILSHP